MGIFSNYRLVVKHFDARPFNDRVDSSREMNQPALALLACQKVKSILREKSNYKRLSDIDLFESNCLILLSEQEEAQKKKTILL